jgi:hypothetical protein
MLETIREFADEKLAGRGAAAEARTAHSRHFAHRQAQLLAIWDSPRQREFYDWFARELPNLRTAFRWAADRGDIDTACDIACHAGFIGAVAEVYEPPAWAEQLIEPAEAVHHRRLAALYLIASHCYTAGRVAEAIEYSEAGQKLMDDGYRECPSESKAHSARSTWLPASPNDGSMCAGISWRAITTRTRSLGHAPYSH